MGQYCLNMRTITITIAFLLTATSTYGGVVRRSVSNKPYNNAKELLQMKGVSQRIKEGFENAGAELQTLATKLENEVESLSQLTAYLDLKDTKRMKDALAEAMNIKSLMNVQRTELSGLAKQTVSKCESIRKRFEQIVAGDKELDAGMKSLLRTSETKLTEAKKTTFDLTEKVNNVLASLTVFKGMIVAANEQQKALDQNKTPQAIGSIFTGVIGSIKDGMGKYRKAKNVDKTMSVVDSILEGISRLTVSIIKVSELGKDLGPRVTAALDSVNEAQAIIEKQKEHMGKELELIGVWRNTVEVVKNDVFDSDLTDRAEGEDKSLYEEIEEIMEDEDDMAEIYEAFDGLKDAAQAYINQVKKSCPDCIV